MLCITQIISHIQCGLMIFSAVICTNCGFLTTMIQQGMTDDLEIEGIYSGTFTVTYNFAKRTGTTTLKLENGKFTCAGNLDRIPAGGSGNYSINHDKIVYSDKNFGVRTLIGI